MVISGMTSLNLANNRLGAEGAKTVADMLPKCKYVAHQLYIKHNNLYVCVRDVFCVLFKFTR